MPVNQTNLDVTVARTGTADHDSIRENTIGMRTQATRDYEQKRRDEVKEARDNLNMTVQIDLEALGVIMRRPTNSSDLTHKKLFEISSLLLELVFLL
jgi:hypothetical protein